MKQKIKMGLYWTALGVAIGANVYLPFADFSDWEGVAISPSLSKARLAEVENIGNVGNVTDLLERPLFMADRRPYREKAVPSAPPIADNLADVSLLGIMTVNAKNSAIIKARDSTKSVRVIVGDKVRAWTVKSIAKDGIVLELDGREIALTNRSSTNLAPQKERTGEKDRLYSPPKN